MRSIHPHALGLGFPLAIGLLVAAQFVLLPEFHNLSTQHVGKVQWVSPTTRFRPHLPRLYFFTADWCPPCRAMERAVFSDGRVAGLVDRCCVAVRVTDTLRERGANTAEVCELQNRYRVTAFPTVVVVDIDGRVVAREVGYRDVEQLLAALEQVSRAPVHQQSTGL